MYSSREQPFALIRNYVQLYGTATDHRVDELGSGEEAERAEAIIDEYDNPV